MKLNLSKLPTLAVLGACALSFAAVVPKTCVARPTGYVEPIIECVQDNKDGTYTAHFGYQNNTTKKFDIEIGDYNQFSPGDISRGQPTEFSSGREYGAFKVVFDGQPLTWGISTTEDLTSNESSSSGSLSTVTVSSESVEQYPCKIVPITECVVRHYTYDNSSNYYGLRAYFGYYNPFGESVTIPKGQESNNLYSNYGYDYLVENENQTETFLPGRVHGAFSAMARMPSNWNGYYGVNWFLKGSENSSETVYADWNNTRECRLYPKAGCIKDGCELEGERGDRTASFGYENKELFAVKHQKHDNYNELYPRNGCEWNNNNGSGLDIDGNICSYPQPDTFEPGVHQNAFSACFDSTSNYNDEGGFVSLRWRLGHGWNDDWYSHNVAVGVATKYCNRPPTCDAGTIYKSQCSGEITHLFLNGHLSSDPDKTALGYNWTTDCKQAALTGENTLNPILSMLVPGTGPAQDCNVSLSVSEAEGEDMFAASCNAKVEYAACNLDSLLGAKGVNCSSADLSKTLAELIRDSKQIRRFSEHWSKTAENKLGSNQIDSRKFIEVIGRISQENLAAIFSLPTVALADCTGNTDCKTTNHSSVKSLLIRNQTRTSNITRQVGKRLARAGFVKENRRIVNSLRSLAQKRSKLLSQIPESSLQCS